MLLTPKVEFCMSDIICSVSGSSLLVRHEDGSKVGRWPPLPKLKNIKSVTQAAITTTITRVGGAEARGGRATISRVGFFKSTMMDVLATGGWQRVT